MKRGAYATFHIYVTDMNRVPVAGASVWALGGGPTHLADPPLEARCTHLGHTGEHNGVTNASGALEVTDIVEVPGDYCAMFRIIPPAESGLDSGFVRLPSVPFRENRSRPIVVEVMLEPSQQDSSLPSSSETAIAGVSPDH
jgi:hypothetical protein